MNIHQAIAHFCGLDSAVKGVCVCVCVCGVCVYAQGRKMPARDGRENEREGLGRMRNYQ